MIIMKEEMVFVDKCLIGISIIKLLVDGEFDVIIYLKMFLGKVIKYVL